MKKVDYYKSEFPLEDLLPDLNNKEPAELTRCEVCFINPKVPFEEMEIELNEIDQKNIDIHIEEYAAEFFNAGYEHAQLLINKKLRPVDKLDIKA